MKSRAAGGLRGRPGLQTALPLEGGFGAMGRLPRKHLWTMFGLLLAACVALLLEPANGAPGPPQRPVKNIIVMISDGCGYNHVQAASLYATGRPVSFAFQRFPVRLATKTDALAWGDGGTVAPRGYDPARAWTEFDYVKSGATDSAAAATAMATGVEAFGGAIGVSCVVDEHGVVQKDADGENAIRPVRNVLEACEELGMATGVVTSVQFAHATPAGFVAHNRARGNYEAIAREMILQSPIDLIMGCGHPRYWNGGRPTAEPIDYQYVGGEDTWAALTAGTAGADVDADHNGMPDDEWTLLQTRAEFQALAKGAAPKRVIGIPHAHGTLQQGRHRSEDAAEPFDDPLTQDVPTLAEMAAGALNVLDDDPDGLFLMIEGGAVDWAAHSNQSERMASPMPCRPSSTGWRRTATGARRC
jgi:alkaline phosphatase